MRKELFFTWKHNDWSQRKQLTRACKKFSLTLPKFQQSQQLHATEQRIEKEGEKQFCLLAWTEHDGSTAVEVGLSRWVELLAINHFLESPSKRCTRLIQSGICLFAGETMREKVIVEKKNERGKLEWENEGREEWRSIWRVSLSTRLSYVRLGQHQYHHTELWEFCTFYLAVSSKSFKHL